MTTPRHGEVYVGWWLLAVIGYNIESDVQKVIEGGGLHRTESLFQNGVPQRIKEIASYWGTFSNLHNPV